MADPIDWQARVQHYRRLWRQERRRRRQVERSLNELLSLDRTSNQGDKALEKIVDLCQQMTRDALASATRRKA